MKADLFFFIEGVERRKCVFEREKGREGVIWRVSGFHFLCKGRIKQLLKSRRYLSVLLREKSLSY